MKTMANERTERTARTRARLMVTIRKTTRRGKSEAVRRLFRVVYQYSIMSFSFRVVKFMIHRPVWSASRGCNCDHDFLSLMVSWSKSSVPGSREPRRCFEYKWKQGTAFQEICRGNN